MTSNDELQNDEIRFWMQYTQRYYTYKYCNIFLSASVTIFLLLILVSFYFRNEIYTTLTMSHFQPKNPENILSIILMIFLIIFLLICRYLYKVKKAIFFYLLSTMQNILIIIENKFKSEQDISSYELDSLYGNKILTTFYKDAVNNIKSNKKWNTDIALKMDKLGYYKHQKIFLIDKWLS